MTRHEKVLTALEELCRRAGTELKVEIFKTYGEWMIVLSAGNISAVQTTLGSFTRDPMMVFDPFGEELIKRMP